MNIHIRVAGIELTPAIEEYVNRKGEMLKKFADMGSTPADLAVEVGKTTAHHKSGDIFRAEFQMHTKNGDFRTVSENIDLYSAIDTAKDEMLEILRSGKDKRQTLFRRGKQKIKDMMRGLTNRD